MPQTNAEWLTAFRQYLMPNYDPAPVAFARGQGATLWDVEGKRYIDLAAGVAVCSLGHSHPRLVKAITEQARTLMHTSNLYLIPNQIELARRLVELSGLDRAFFCNSGTEAMEAALKLSRLWGRNNGGRGEFVSTHHGFHGRSMGALSLTGQHHYHDGFEPLVPGVTFVPYGDPDAIRGALTPKTCAVVLEPVQGEGGVNVPPPKYLSEVRKVCDEAGVLLVLDEVQTGIGRTGTWFAFQQAGVRPDVVALAKGLGGGFPIGAVLCNERANAFRPGAHGSTFGGNPLATAAALATLSTIEEEGLLANVAVQSRALMDRLRAWQNQAWIRSPRGRGLLAGFDVPGGSSKAFARDLVRQGVLVTNIGESTLRLCPPLTITHEELSTGLSVMERRLSSNALAPLSGARP